MTDAIPEDVRRLLDERARALAAPVHEPESDEALELVVLALGRERYGVDVRLVREVQPVASVTPVPSVPSVWAGLMNVRGSLYPVLDLGRFLELPDGRADRPRAVLVASGRSALALLADDVPEVRRVAVSAVNPPFAGTAGPRGELVTGVTDDLLSVLDLAPLFEESRLIVRDEVS
jgi:purine-binding chemotaxis protein CheW